MTRYLLSIQQPDGPPPADVDLDAVMRGVGEVLDDMRSRSTPTRERPRRPTGGR